MFRFSFFYRFTVCFWSAAFNFAAGAQRSGLLSVVVRPPFRQALPKKSVFFSDIKASLFFFHKKARIEYRIDLYFGFQHAKPGTTALWGT